MFCRCLNVFVVLCASVVLLAEPASAEIGFATVADPSGKPIAVELRGLDETTRAELENLSRWPALFDVRVTDAAADSPGMAGSFALHDNAIRFQPRFAFQAGLTYRAELTPAAAKVLKVGSHRWSIPEATGEMTEVEAVYPSADTLPENHLKFYLHFTAPMSRGEAYRHLRLLRGDGSEVDLPFLEIGEELWDRSGKRLTLLIDPGRIKQGVKPREDIGPVLEAGGRYRLVIDAGWKDAAGRPLGSGHEKSFAVGPPVAGALQPQDWKFELPKPGTREPLTVRFPAPLDHALLQRTLWVESAGDEIRGQGTAKDRESAWQFVPESAWKAGEFELVVDTVLEDLGGNRIGSAFEVDALDPLQKRVELKTVRLPVTIAPIRP